MDDDSDEFVQQLLGSYGKMETLMGTEAYQLFIEERRERHQAHILEHQATVKVLEAQADRYEASAILLRAVAMVVLFFGMPILVWLWVWAVRAF